MTARHRGLVSLIAVTCVVAAGGVDDSASAVPITVHVVDVSQSTPSGDVAAQNETPIAINPANSRNMITGDNDWNANNSCGVNASFNGGATWTPTLPDGFVPGITEFTNDPAVAGTGPFFVSSDPSVAFSPDGTIAYFACLGFDITPPYHTGLLLSRSTDGGRTWQPSGLTKVSTWDGVGKSRGSTGQAPDHDNLHVDNTTGWVYATWTQIHGHSEPSPVVVAISRDQGASFTLTVVPSGSVRGNQDQRVVTDEHGNAYVVWDNRAQGHKGNDIYASVLPRGSNSWSAPILVGRLINPVCVFAPDCFNISGGQFRAGGGYPAVAFDTANDRLYVTYADIKSGYGQIYVQSAAAADLTHWAAPVAVAPGAGDQFEGEISVAPNGRLDVSFYDRRYSANTLLDVTYATSSDGGVTWRTQRVTSSGFDPSQWQVQSGPTYPSFIGDYNGIASTNANAELAWTGVSPPAPGNLDVYVATVTS